MSRYFVLAYKRSAGRLIEPVYESGGIADATSQRYNWEQKYRSAEQDIEVAVLTAPSLADLRKTHSRYFRSLSEMVKG